MVVIFSAPHKFFQRQNDRVHIAPKRYFRAAETVAYLPKTGLAHDQQVHVAMRPFFPARYRPKDECRLNLQWLQQLPQHFHQSGRLEHQIAKIREQWMPYAGAEVHSISILACFNQSKPNQALKFLPNRGDTQTRTPFNLAQVQFSLGMAEEQAKDFGFDTRRKDFRQCIHNVLLYHTIVRYCQSISILSKHPRIAALSGEGTFGPAVSKTPLTLPSPPTAGRGYVGANAPLQVRFGQIAQQRGLNMPFSPGSTGFQPDREPMFTLSIGVTFRRRRQLLVLHPAPLAGFRRSSFRLQSAA